MFYLRGSLEWLTAGMGVLIAPLGACHPTQNPHHRPVYVTLYGTILCACASVSIRLDIIDDMWPGPFAVAGSGGGAALDIGRSANASSVRVSLARVSACNNSGLAGGGGGGLFLDIGDESLGLANVSVALTAVTASNNSAEGGCVLCEN